MARGYTATKDQLTKRLARIEGQIRGISKMVDEDRYCTDVLDQINAARAALDKVALGLLDGHARHCLVGGGGAGGSGAAGAVCRLPVSKRREQKWTAGEGGSCQLGGFKDAIFAVRPRPGWTHQQNRVRPV